MSKKDSDGNPLTSRVSRRNGTKAGGHITAQRLTKGAARRARATVERRRQTRMPSPHNGDLGVNKL